MKLVLNNLTKEYNSQVAVKDLEFTMEKGIYGLLGTNGAGKTTLMRMICTLMKPSRGSITCDGKDIFEMGGAYRRMIGYLPQNFGFYPDLSAREYLKYIAEIKGLRPAVAKDRIEMLLEKIGLKDTGKKKLKAFSGGMIRRVGIAQAVLNDPEILVLDEPTAGLDPNERIRFRNLITELAEKRMVILSTHIVSDVEFIANRIMLMKNGRFSFIGTAEELVGLVADKVWTCTVPAESVGKYTGSFPIANMRSTDAGVELRIVAETKPAPEVKSEQPTLEDAFFFYFGERTEENE